MAKSDEKPAAEAAPIQALPAPQMIKTVVSVKATIPLQQYGNQEVFISQEMLTDIDLPQQDRLQLTADLIGQLKFVIAAGVAELASAEVERAMPELVKAADPDVWMQLKNPVYRWLRVASPDMKIPAMEKFLAKRLEKAT